MYYSKTGQYDLQTQQQHMKCTMKTDQVDGVYMEYCINSFDKF